MNKDTNPDPSKTPDPTPDKTKPEVILPGREAPEPIVVEKKDAPEGKSVEQPSDHVHNPNPRANENLPDDPAAEKKTRGPGSEITDGEDG